MADGEVPGGSPHGELTPEQRVDAGIADARFGQAGLGSLGIGERMSTGGGGDGQFVFANLAELDEVIVRWKAERDRFQHDGDTFRDAIQLCKPPADDVMSQYQAGMGVKSLTEAWNHHKAMFAYADGYVQKLEASRAAMAGTEQDNASRLRKPGEG